MGFRTPLVRKMPVFYATMELKLTDMGLVGVNKFDLVSLFVDGA